MIFPEVKVFQPDDFKDHRGSLYTLFNQKDHDIIFNHDKVSISKKGVLRGLHGDFKSWKLFACLAGEIYLVVVDVRDESPNHFKWDRIILTPKNRYSVLIPPRFATGHYILSEEATLFYKWSYPGEYPDVQDQFTYKWNNPHMGIIWPSLNPILSERDK